MFMMKWHQHTKQYKKKFYFEILKQLCEMEMLLKRWKNESWMLHHKRALDYAFLLVWLFLVPSSFPSQHIQLTWSCETFFSVSKTEAE